MAPQEDEARRRVLLVEDNVAHARLLVDLLQALEPPVEVRQTGTLEGAKERLDTEHFHVIIADLHLPDGQGLSVISRIADAARGAPIVVVSAVDDEAVRLEALSGHALDWIVKDSVTLEVLGHAIRMASQRAAVARALRVAADVDRNTGALTRHGLERASLRQISLAQRQNHPLAVVRLDVDARDADQFDEFTRVAVDTARDSDLVGRIAPNHIVVVLPDDSTDPPAILGRLQGRLERAGLSSVPFTTFVNRLELGQRIDGRALLNLPPDQEPADGCDDETARVPLRRLLLASVDDGLADAVRTSLGARWRVLTATNAGQAMRCAALEQPDIALVDLALPDDIAAVVARTIAQQRETSGVPIIGVGAPEWTEGSAPEPSGLPRVLERRYVGGELGEVVRRLFA